MPTITRVRVRPEAGGARNRGLGMAEWRGPGAENRTDRSIVNNRLLARARARVPSPPNCLVRIVEQRGKFLRRHTHEFSIESVIDSWRDTNAPSYERYLSAVRDSRERGGERERSST